VAAGRVLKVLYAERLEEAYDRLACHYARTDETDKAARSYAHAEALKGRLCMSSFALLTSDEEMRNYDEIGPMKRRRSHGRTTRVRGYPWRGLECA
jgi:hypothetical protein